MLGFSEEEKGLIMASQRARFGGGPSLAADVAGAVGGPNGKASLAEAWMSFLEEAVQAEEGGKQQQTGSGAAAGSGPQPFLLHQHQHQPQQAAPAVALGLGPAAHGASGAAVAAPVPGGSSAELGLHPPATTAALTAGQPAFTVGPVSGVGAAGVPPFGGGYSVAPAGLAPSFMGAGGAAPTAPYGAAAPFPL